jgi:hypothetical protein
MSGMGDHSRPAVGRVPRRAMFSAWAVFLSMAGTTMTFQVYHSIRVGQMPWPLAVLEGVVPLGVSIGVLEYVAVWKSKLTWAAYVITAGAMFMSAVATGSVVVYAAPPHMSGLFGILLDAAALLSIRFILTAPRAAREKAEAEASEAERLTRKLAEVTASARTEITGLREAASVSEAGRAEAVARSEAEARRAAGLSASAQAQAGKSAEVARELEVLTARHDEAVASLETAQVRAERAEERARKLAAAADRIKAGNGSRKAATGNRRPTGSATGSDAPASRAEDLVPPEGLTTEELVQWWVDTCKKSPSQAGILAGLSDSRGRQIMRDIRKRSFRVLDGEEQTG